MTALQDMPHFQTTFNLYKTSNGSLIGGE